MFSSRRNFLGRLGVGAAGVAGLLVPGAARAGWCRRGGIVCPPPGAFCLPPPVVQCVDIHTYNVGLSANSIANVVNVQYPTSSADLTPFPGGGIFAVWGVIASGWTMTNLVLAGANSGNSTMITNGWTNMCGVSPMGSPSGSFLFSCYAPVGAYFYLRFVVNDGKNPYNAVLGDGTYPGRYYTIGL